VTAPHFVTKRGPGTKVDSGLAKQWDGFDLAAELGERFDAPVRVANDADVQGAGVITGEGLELVLTLGTGLGSAVFRDGRLALHLELAHHRAFKRCSYNDYVGDRARKKLGAKHWNRRVRKALVALDSLVVADLVLVGGGNAKRVDGSKLRSKLPELASKVRLVGNEGGLPAQQRCDRPVEHGEMGHDDDGGVGPQRGSDRGVDHPHAGREADLGAPEDGGG